MNFERQELKELFPILNYSDDESGDDSEQLDRNEVLPAGLVVYGAPSRTPTTEEVISIIVNNQVEENKVSTTMPKAIRRTSMFVMDLNALAATGQDIEHTSDENGAWTDFSKPRKQYARTEHGRFVPANENTPKENLVSVYRSYRTHKHTREFRCQVITAADGHGTKFATGIIYYYFTDNVEVPVRMLPHGNSKKPSSQPYMRTDKTVLNKLREECKNDTGKSAVDNVFLQKGSVFEYKYTSELPRNTKQAYNMTYQNKQKASASSRMASKPAKHQFYDLLEMVNEGEFAKDISFSTLAGKQNRTSPKTFQATAQQLKDLQRFCSIDAPIGFRSILGIDGAHNCGEFYVTITTFHNQILVSKETGKPMLMIGPSATHTTKTDEDYQYLLQQLDTHSELTNKKDLVLGAVGTDGEAAIENNVIRRYKGKNEGFVHLNCEIHVRDDIVHHCERKIGFKKEQVSSIVGDIFGKQQADTKIKGLVDCDSEEEFDAKLDLAKKKWSDILANEEKATSFFKYLDKYIAPRIKRSMLVPTRTAAGLGNPPTHYTQNANECMNNLVKQKANYTKMEWSMFLHDLQEFTQHQERIMKRAYLGLGDYQLREEFSHHSIDMDQWRTMTKDQQTAFVTKMKTWSVKRLLQSRKVATVEVTGPHGSNIRGMLDDAHNITSTMNGVVPYPGDISGALWFVCSPPTQCSSRSDDVSQPKVFKVEKTKNGESTNYSVVL